MLAQHWKMLTPNVTTGAVSFVRSAGDRYVIAFETAVSDRQQTLLSPGDRFKLGFENRNFMEADDVTETFSDDTDNDESPPTVIKVFGPVEY